MSIEAKIRKLLALADDQAGRPEGERAAEVAARLMREHAVEMSAVAGEPGRAEEVVTRDVDVPQATWRRTLLNVIAKYCDSLALYTRGSRVVHLIGFPHNLDLVEYLDEVCRRQIEEQARDCLRRLGEVRGKRTLGNSFRISAVASLSARLRRLKEKAEGVDAETTALVLSRARQVDDYLARKFPRARRQAASYRPNSAGFAAGNKLRLDRGVAGRSRRALGTGGAS